MFFRWIRCLYRTTKNDRRGCIGSVWHNWPHTNSVLNALRRFTPGCSHTRGLALTATSSDMAANTQRNNWTGHYAYQATSPVIGYFRIGCCRFLNNCSIVRWCGRTHTKPGLPLACIIVCLLSDDDWLTSAQGRTTTRVIMNQSFLELVAPSSRALIASSAHTMCTSRCDPAPLGRIASFALLPPDWEEKLCP